MTRASCRTDHKTSKTTVFKICPSCQYIAMREHESNCPICNGALTQRELTKTSSLRSSLFAQETLHARSAQRTLIIPRNDENSAAAFALQPTTLI